MKKSFILLSMVFIVGFSSCMESGSNSEKGTDMDAAENSTMDRNGSTTATNASSSHA